ncbi:hypothetical protein EW026_g6561 [Hermanssonia centrifuga]|uniref:Uncharacterized protein n=1 Tax=Hermanssonia centrifuga TaxID=98765 RepID=A0A4S4KAN4_9APHY|nr:hypothetical protein EW026_g6561 [Hermanssonia centrifuga]
MVRKLSSTQNPPRRKTHAGLQTYLANVDLAIPHVKEIQPILDYDWYAIDRTLSRSAFIGGCKLSFKQMKSKRRDPRKDILDGLSVRMPYAHSTGILQIEFPGCDDKTNDRNEVFVGRFPWAKTGRTATDDLDVLLAALVPDYPSRRAYIADVIRDSDEWFARIILRNRTSVIEFLRHWKASSLTAGISITTGDTAPSQISASEESMSLEDLTDKDSNKAPTTIVCWLLDYTAGGIEIGADTGEMLFNFEYQMIGHKS